MGRIGLLLRIIGKGGLIGKCAEFYITNEEKGNQFLIECSEQCHNKSMKDYLGEQLTTDIIKYVSLIKKSSGKPGY